MTHRRRHAIVALVLILGCLGILRVEAHEDPCHRWHACPSDSQTYVCGDKGRCDQCPDNQYCLAGTSRVVSSTPPAVAPPAPSPSVTTTPSAVAVCFTPSRHCTDAIVQALSEAKRTILVISFAIFRPYWGLSI